MIHLSLAERQETYLAYFSRTYRTWAIVTVKNIDTTLRIMERLIRTANTLHAGPHVCFGKQSSLNSTIPNGGSWHQGADQTEENRL